MKLRNIKILLPYFSQYKTPIIFGILGIFSLSLLLLPTPFISRHIIDFTIPAKDKTSLIYLMILLLFFLILQKAISYFTSLVFIKTNSKIIMHLRKDLLSKILSLETKEKEQYTNGYLMSRIHDDTKTLQALFVNSFAGILKDVIKFFIGLIALFYLDLRLALIVLILLPFYIFLTWYYTKRIINRTLDTYETTAVMTSQLEESLSLFGLFKIFAKEKIGISKYKDRLYENYSKYIDLSKQTVLNGVIPVFILDLIPIIIVALGGLRIIEGTFSLGSLIAFTNFTAFIFGPASSIIELNVQIRQGLVALERVKYFFDIPSEKSGTVILHQINDIVFKDVCFAYPQNQNNQVLSNFNLKIDSFSRTGLKGPSGKGKSTVTKLLIGLYQAQSGSIEINGRNINEYTLKSIRNRIGYVDQEPMLMNGSIFENILLGLAEDKINKMTTQEQLDNVRAAIEMANADFIYELPNGIYNDIKGYGDSLSVGQKQRIAIARVLINKPDLIILDEATANLDFDSENKIISAIKKLPSKVIVIMISHNKEILAHCQRIIEI